MLKEYLIIEWGGNFMQDYLLALAVFTLSIAILKVIKTVVIKKLKKLADHTQTDFDNVLIKVIDSISWPFYIFLSLYLGFRFIQLPLVAENIIGYGLFILVVYYVVRGVQEIIDYGFNQVINKKKEEESFNPAAINLLNKFAKWGLWVLAAILVLQNLGYNISTLVAGLGIGGLAIALAMQNILSDAFASFSIYFDKPFQPGDFIIAGEDKGIVKKIGIKSTRLQTLQGQELIISNKELTETRIHNYKKMEKRRIVVDLGVTYNTATEKLKRIPNIIKDIINELDLAEIDRVHFKSFGDFSLIFEIVYYVDTPEHKIYMDIQQEINLAIKEKFEEENIEMAYPTQTIIIEKAV